MLGSRTQMKQGREQSTPMTYAESGLNWQTGVMVNIKHKAHPVNACVLCTLTLQTFDRTEIPWTFLGDVILFHDRDHFSFSLIRIVPQQWNYLRRRHLFWETLYFIYLPRYKNLVCILSLSQFQIRPPRCQMFRGPLVILGVLLIILALHGRSTQYGLLQIVPNSSKRQLLNWSRKVIITGWCHKQIEAYYNFCPRSKAFSKSSLEKRFLSRLLALVVTAFHQNLGTNSQILEIRTSRELQRRGNITNESFLTISVNEIRMAYLCTLVYCFTLLVSREIFH